MPNIWKVNSILKENYILVTITKCALSAIKVMQLIGLFFYAASVQKREVYPIAIYNIDHLFMSKNFLWISLRIAVKQEKW